MGSRGRSIRLRIYFLVAIPLIALVGLLAYVAGTSINNAISLDRAPNLVNATAVPAAKFGTYLQAERAAAVVYLFQPTAANLAAYEAATAATDRAEPAFIAAMNSQGTTGTENSTGAKTVSSLVSGLSQLPTLRNAVKARAVSPLDALGLYSQGITTQLKLFLVQTESVTLNDQQIQAVGLIATVQAREQLSQEDALLAGMLAAKRITPKNRIAFNDLAATRQADLAYANYILSPANLATFNASMAGSGPMQQDLAGIEQAIAAGTPAAKLPVTQAEWQQLAGTLLKDDYNGGVAVANAILVADHRNSHSAWVRVAVTSGIALLGLLITILVTTLVGRGIIRRLRGLERSARTLAEDQLPDVIARLRRGEDVDVAAEAPPLRTGGDEIGRVGQAFELVRQTAIRAAVEEARLRRGLNDVFRSLARRSQSLLHRQLTLLDQMERRATDPEALDDLFRLDHLTTRMRRHAEGLVILAGAPPGRAWSSPVRMVDVMRGAIAEVEDYARVSVATRSQAALAGSAVADVIHLLAELIENATTLSPPYTSVRVSGDTVASGFAIEVEDRGLGMSPQRLAELNERLASPPEFNPSDSEQLGLFVVSQLAKRHGIRVTLKASPYGGTAAIVLIPQPPGGYRGGVPGRAARRARGDRLAAGSATNGNHLATELAGPTGFARGVPHLGGQRAPGGSRSPHLGPAAAVASGTPEGTSRGAHAAAPRGEAGPTGPAVLRCAVPHAGRSRTARRPAPGRRTARPSTRTSTCSCRCGAARAPTTARAPTRSGRRAGSGRGPLRGRRHVSSPPYAGSAPFADQPRRSRVDRPRAAGGPVAPGAAGPRRGPRRGGHPDEAGGLAPARQGVRSAVGAVTPDRTASGDPRRRRSGPPDGPGADSDVNGLPRRVRQASLAPQLRDNPPRRPTSAGRKRGPGQRADPAEIRQTMLALQRGWQEGRSQRMTAPGDRFWPGSGADADRGALRTARAADEPGGESDGT